MVARGWAGHGVFGLLRGLRTVGTEEDGGQRQKAGGGPRGGAAGEAGAPPSVEPSGAGFGRPHLPAHQLPGTLRMKPERFLVKSGCGWLSRVSTETVHFFPCRLHCTGLVTLT